MEKLKKSVLDITRDNLRKRTIEILSGATKVKADAYVFNIGGDDVGCCIPSPKLRRVFWFVRGVQNISLWKTWVPNMAYNHRVMKVPRTELTKLQLWLCVGMFLTQNHYTIITKKPFLVKDISPGVLLRFGTRTYRTPEKPIQKIELPPTRKTLPTVDALKDVSIFGVLSSSSGTDLAIGYDIKRKESIEGGDEILQALRPHCSPEYLPVLSVKDNKRKSVYRRVVSCKYLDSAFLTKLNIVPDRFHDDKVKLNNVVSMFSGRLKELLLGKRGLYISATDARVLRSVPVDLKLVDSPEQYFVNDDDSIEVRALSVCSMLKTKYIAEVVYYLWAFRGNLQAIYEYVGGVDGVNDTYVAYRRLAKLLGVRDKVPLESLGKEIAKRIEEKVLSSEVDRDKTLGSVVKRGNIEGFLLRKQGGCDFIATEKGIQKVCDLNTSNKQTAKNRMSPSTVPLDVVFYEDFSQVNSSTLPLKGVLSFDKNYNAKFSIYSFRTTKLRFVFPLGNDARFAMKPGEDITEHVKDSAWYLMVDRPVILRKKSKPTKLELVRIIERKGFVGENGVTYFEKKDLITKEEQAMLKKDTISFLNGPVGPTAKKTKIDNGITISGKAGFRFVVFHFRAEGANNPDSTNVLMTDQDIKELTGNLVTNNRNNRRGILNVSKYLLSAEVYRSLSV